MHSIDGYFGPLIPKCIEQTSTLLDKVHVMQSDSEKRL